MADIPSPAGKMGRHMHGIAIERGEGHGRRRAGWLLLALLALVVPHLLAIVLPPSLDAMGPQNGPPLLSRRHSSEQAGDNFPGSAFFFAQGAFDPVPGAALVRSAHVLGLERTRAAPSHVFRGVGPLDSYRALNCLTSAIYYEGANEPDEGQQAIAQVVLNRVRNPAWPRSICGVVYQGSERADLKCQFSFACDGAMTRPPMMSAWARARRAAAAALAGHVFPPVGLATHYHTLAVRPDWSGTLDAVAVVGAHIFYRPRGAAGAPPAFLARYSGHELQSGPSPRAYAPLQPLPPSSAPLLPFVNPGSEFRTPPIPAAPAQNWDAELPISTIRPEYRNSGRPLTAGN
ncbi:cell wall hydrolase [Sphingobium sp. H39-3-25]|uniref:cell wall hydrolase n=1 Tax=Sphingobium arseniciresistens TaxID=3030834 RepID=UPI0023B9732A|nr:cell wall hydrolase [Sphingobium arseniciresistens]